MLCIWNPYGLALPDKVTDRCRYCEVVWKNGPFPWRWRGGCPTLHAPRPTPPPPPPPSRPKNKNENIPKLLSRYSGITKIYLVVYYPVVLSFITRFAFLKRHMRLGQQYVIGWKSQLLVCTRHGGHCGEHEQMHFSPIGTNSIFV